LTTSDTEGARISANRLQAVVDYPTAMTGMVPDGFRIGVEFDL